MPLLATNCIGMISHIRAWIANILVLSTILQPSAYAANDEDLPAVGRSAFDQLVKNDKESAGYDIPYPFTKLIAKIRERLEYPERISALFFPFGRSLQKFAADPHYFKFPRTVVAVTGSSKQDSRELAIDFKSKLFIGYVEPMNSLEVISYNRDAGRFEYQIVKDYQKGRKPILYYAKRNLCLSCHESGVPIFPSEPWSETNDNNFVADNIISARHGEDKYHDFPIRLNDLPGRGFSSEALHFDNAIHDATALIYNQYRQELICPPRSRTRIDCLANAFIVSLANYYNIWLGPNWPPLLAFKARVEEFYGRAEPIEVPFGFIPDREPLTNRPVESMTAPNPSFEKLKGPALIAMLKSNITYLQSFADPKKSRKTVAKPIRERCLLPDDHQPQTDIKWCETVYFFETLDARRLLEIKKAATREGKFKFNLIEAALQKMAIASKKDHRRAFAQIKIDREQFFYELLAELSGDQPKQICCLKPLRFAPKVLSEADTAAKLRPLIKNPAIGKFIDYCINCHGNAGIEYPIQFVSGGNEVGIVDRIRGMKSSIASCLENRDIPMPPTSSREHQLLFKNPQDRQLMLDFVK